MAVPRVFISSTCYDLKYIRENLKYFINSIGYESILSEEGDVFYNPTEHTHDSCINEVGTCQIFVLIIGGRYGGKYLESEKSITNKEYEQALKLEIPIFTLIEKNVLNEHFVYQKNKTMPLSNKIIYPSVDDIKIFGFIDEVRKNNRNNAIFPFSDFRDIENYLKKQWAGMVYNFLTNHSETRKVSELFEEIHRATDNIEYYTKQLAIHVGDKHTSVLIKCYETLLGSQVIRDLNTCWNIKVTPYMIIRNSTLNEICDHQIEFEEENDNEKNSITYSFNGPPYICSRIRYDDMRREYSKLRFRVLDVLKENGFTKKEFLKMEENTK